MRKLKSLTNHQKFIYAYNALLKILNVDAESDGKKEFVINMNAVTTNFDAYIHNLEVLLRQLKIPCKNLKENLLTEAEDYETDEELEYVANVLNKLCDKYPYDWKTKQPIEDLAIFQLSNNNS